MSGNYCGPDPKGNHLMIVGRSTLLCLAGARSTAADSSDRCRHVFLDPLRASNGNGWKC